MSDFKYSEQVDIENIQKLRKMLSELPAFFKDFFRGIEPRTLSRTRIAYAYDIKVFLEFLLNENPSIKSTYSKISDIPLSVLENLSVTDIEEFMEYLKYRDSEGRKISNKEPLPVTGAATDISTRLTTATSLGKREMLLLRRQAPISP